MHRPVDSRNNNLQNPSTFRSSSKRHLSRDKMSSLLPKELCRSRSLTIDLSIIRLTIGRKRLNLVNHRVRLQGPRGLWILCCQSLRNPSASWKSSLMGSISKRSRSLKTTTPVRSSRSLEIISIWVRERGRDCSSRSKNKYRWTRMKMQIDELKNTYEAKTQRRYIIINYFLFLYLLNNFL